MMTIAAIGIGAGLVSALLFAVVDHRHRRWPCCCPSSPLSPSSSPRSAGTTAPARRRPLLAALALGALLDRRRPAHRLRGRLRRCRPGGSPIWRSLGARRSNGAWNGTRSGALLLWIAALGGADHRAGALSIILGERRATTAYQTRPARCASSGLSQTARTRAAQDPADARMAAEMPSRLIAVPCRCSSRFKFVLMLALDLWLGGARRAGLRAAAAALAPIPAIVMPQMRARPSRLAIGLLRAAASSALLGLALLGAAPRGSVWRSRASPHPRRLPGSARAAPSC